MNVTTSYLKLSKIFDIKKISVNSEPLHFDYVVLQCMSPPLIYSQNNHLKTRPEHPSTSRRIIWNLRKWKIWGYNERQREKKKSKERKKRKKKFYNYSFEFTSFLFPNFSWRLMKFHLYNLSGEKRYDFLFVFKLLLTLTTFSIYYVVHITVK